MVGLMKEQGQPLHKPESELAPKFCTLAGDSYLGLQVGKKEREVWESTPKSWIHAPCRSDALDTAILRTDSGCPQGGTMPWEGVGGTSVMCRLARNRGHHFNES